MTETAFQFGDGAALFGVFHEPRRERRRDLAVLFCAPFAEEKKCSYRTFVEAARAFAEAGIASLRFDYYGTGDSTGEFREFTPARAMDDIAAAAATLSERTGGAPVALLGLRLGATMALAAAPRAAAHRVVLWQPVLSGKQFFDRTVHRHALRRQLIDAAGGNENPPGGQGFDLDGYPVSEAAAEQVRSLDCVAAARNYAGPVFLLQISHSKRATSESRELLDVLGDRLAFAAVVCPPFWNRIDRCDPSPVIGATRAWLESAVPPSDVSNPGNSGA